MGWFDALFGKRLFGLSPNDAKMLARMNSVRVCELCHCFRSKSESEPEDAARQYHVPMHTELQDTNGEAWKLLETLIEEAAQNRSKEFAPGLVMPLELWKQIITLPPTIAKLTSVRSLYLYGSNLVRIPPAIGKMKNLEELDFYTSYRLHWLPYEVTRCRKLVKSRASTRALYGNYKYRHPFPKLDLNSSNNAHPNCSVCDKVIAAGSLHPVWITLRVATDFLPLLVTACSQACVQKLPKPPKGFVPHPHSGGPALMQPVVGIQVRGEVLSFEELEKLKL